MAMASVIAFFCLSPDDSPGLAAVFYVQQFVVSIVQPMGENDEFAILAAA
jgi:hypothetical protein